MKKVWLAAVGLAIAGVGCGPRLAQTPYGEKEQEWTSYVKGAYPGWTPPKTIPPVETARISEGRPAMSPPPVADEMIIDYERTTIEIPVAPALTPAVQMETPAPVKAAPAAETYTVKQGDTLWKISNKVYGNGVHWKKIQEANKTILKGGTNLKPGMILDIPAP